MVNIVKLHVHARQLLLEEFASARRALVAGKTGDNLVVLINRIDHQVFTAQGNQRINRIMKFLQGFLDAERLDDAVDI